MRFRRIRYVTCAAVVATLVGLGLTASPAPASPYCAFLNDISQIQARHMQNASSIGARIHWYSLWQETQQDLEGGKC